MTSPDAQHGFTLIEMVVALVIIGIAGAVLLSVFVTPVANSANPQIIAQARSIASAYMDEILLQGFGSGPGDCGQSSRADFDTVWCYDAIGGETPTNQFGNAIPALSDYTVAVNVSGNNAQAAIAVSVTHAGGFAFTLDGRRGNY